MAVAEPPDLSCRGRKSHYRVAECQTLMKPSLTVVYRAGLSENAEKKYGYITPPREIFSKWFLLNSC